jgi:ferredoxin
MPLKPGHSAGRAGIAVIYHSAAGGTRLVARLLGELLSAEHDARVSGVTEAGAADMVAASDLTILCYPTYFLRPSPSTREFIRGLARPPQPKPVYLVTTYELYTENSLRACALMLRDTGFVVRGSAAIRAPGSDLTCVIPDRLCGWLYRFEPGLPEKLRGIARAVGALARDGGKERIPAWKWYTPAAQTAQKLFLDGFINWRDRLRILPERCTDCGACVRGCARGAWRREGDAIRLHAERCELCTRCIHHCPAHAIVLARALRDNRRLDARHFADIEVRARGSLGIAVLSDGGLGENRLGVNGGAEGGA